MNEYHKIQTLFKRDMERNGKTLLEGQWTLPEFEFLSGNTWVFTEKVDGTNIRVMLKDGGITFGGKTDSAQIPAQLVTRLNDRRRHAAYRCHCGSKVRHCFDVGLSGCAAMKGAQK